MAKYKAYPEYKTISNSWLDSIPKGWELLPLKYLCTSFVKDGPHETPVFQEEGIPFLSVDGIQNNKLVFEGCRYISSSDHYRFSQKCKPVKGDVLLGKAASIGKVALVNTSIEFNVWSPLAVINPIRSCLSKFIYYSFQTTMLQAQCEVYSNSNTQKNLGMNTIDNLDFAMPSDKEASTISNFLDHETTKIDNLIEKQQQLIELLKEKRQAVISHAVTKGLNPDVPMKDSGVEWLGEVPEHWKIKRCKNLFDFVTSGSRGWAGFYSDEGDLFFRIANLTRDSINPKLDSIQYVTPPKGSEGERSKIKENDLLISITADLGSVCAADESISGGYVSQHVSLCRPGRLVASSRWLAFFVLSDTAKEQLQGAGYGGTKVQLSLEDIRDLFVAYPPKSEQIKIASYLDERLSELDGLDHRAHNLIELLRERRTALISAAVTGKIDVRDWVAPDTQDVEEPQEATA
ncbi:TPA: restriction endonuclease subunit S [Enterobacter asburiae]